MSSRDTGSSVRKQPAFGPTRTPADTVAATHSAQTIGALERVHTIDGTRSYVRDHRFGITDGGVGPSANEPCGAVRAR